MSGNSFLLAIKLYCLLLDLSFSLSFLTYPVAWKLEVFISFNIENERFTIQLEIRKVTDIFNAT